MLTREGARPATAEQRLRELGIKLPAPPEPFGTYVEAVQTSNLLFLTGMLPTEGRAAKFIGRVVQTTDVEIIEVKFQEIDQMEKVLLVERVAASEAV